MEGFIIGLNPRSAFFIDLYIYLVSLHMEHTTIKLVHHICSLHVLFNLFFIIFYLYLPKLKTTHVKIYGCYEAYSKGAGLLPHALYELGNRGILF